MIFAGVNIPDKLIRAQRDGKLVIFAGAGVSIPRPTLIPGSEELKQEIAKHIKVRGFSGQEYLDYGKPLEEYLSTLEVREVRTHDLLKWIFSTPPRKPNDLHYLTLRLFVRPDDIRIITTNYDNMFEEAVRKIFPSGSFNNPVPEYVYGDNLVVPFNGIVHLNGTITRGDRPIIISRLEHETQFKSVNWPGSVIDPIFLEYAILFVGYSHRDGIFNNYARKIASEAGYNQFAFVLKGEEDNWNGYGVTTIPYDRHETLRDVLQDWVNQI